MRPLVYALCLIMLAALWVDAAADRPVAVGTAQQYVSQGTQAFQSGAFDAAILHWRQAAHLYEQQGNASARSATLVQVSQAYQALGLYQQALESLNTAQTLASQAQDGVQLATVLWRLGSMALIANRRADAARDLQAGLALARQAHQVELEAYIQSTLGDVFRTLDSDNAAALEAYNTSLRLSQQVNNPTLTGRVLIQTAAVDSQQGQYSQAQERLRLAWEQLQRLSPSHDQAYQLINLALAYKALRAQPSQAQAPWLLQAARALQAAASAAQSVGDARVESYAWGHLGALYEGEQRYQEALQLTRQAVFAAQQVQAPEALYRWQEQTGRLLNRLGQRDQAIAAYARAVDTVESFRQEMVLGYGQRRFSFRQTVESVYFGLVDLLLQRAAARPPGPEREQDLRSAQESVEKFKVVELQDYFNDCVRTTGTQVTQLQDVAADAAVIYPIILPDRLELLVALPGGLQRFATPVPRDTLQEQVLQLRENLEDVGSWPSEYLPLAQKVYDWIIRPLEPLLVSARVKTLVFVPDGLLRTIPMAALHDGQHFLISKYAVVTAPSLQLIDPHPLQRDKMHIVVAGLSQAIYPFAALPHVPAELQAIQDIYKGHISAAMLDETFVLSRAEAALREKRINVVHIASHATFGSTADETFILMYKDKLTLDRLDRIIGSFQFRDQPLDLLTLSACQTASGDDRAALGLAGIAIKAGARSALATLWFIDDEASAILMETFYRYLQDTSLSRATALQQAQLSLMEKDWTHPHFWAPFLLINNWL